jgi:hypothetical protein
MDDNPHTHSGIYTYRDCPVVTDLHATRTAASMAGFFLPHLRPGMRVLDCGCGPGSITVGLAEHVAPGEVIGIDLDPTHIALAQRRAAAAGPANVRFARGISTPCRFPMPRLMRCSVSRSCPTSVRQRRPSGKYGASYSQPASWGHARWIPRGCSSRHSPPSCCRCGTYGSRWCDITAGIRALANSSVRWCAKLGSPISSSRPRMNVLGRQDRLGGRPPSRWWSIGR